MAESQEAARQLFDEYVERLLALARRRINLRLARRVDAEDVVQSVFRTFFQRLQAGNFRLEGQDDLAKVLVRITVRKTLRHIAFHQAARRDLRLEEEGSSYDPLPGLIGREPTPAAAVAFLDQLEHFLGRLRPQERQILEMRLQGFSSEEIAGQLGTYDRKVRRVLERVRALAEQEDLTSP
jgi:RNA polymerase sigma-70 factor (ECF subfamily)